LAFRTIHFDWLPRTRQTGKSVCYIRPFVAASVTGDTTGCVEAIHQNNIRPIRVLERCERRVKVFSRWLIESEIPVGALCLNVQGAYFFKIVQFSIAALFTDGLILLSKPVINWRSILGPFLLCSNSEKFWSNLKY